MKIFIDPGHNAPYDSGAVGLLKEDEETLKVGKELAGILASGGHSVQSTKVLDTISSTTESLQARSRQSNEWGAELFVSIHFNAYKPTDGPMGSEVFAMSDSGKKVAARVVKNLENLGFKSRGVKDGSHLFVVKHTSATAILVEVCFLDSLVDAALYEKVGSRGVAMSIALAIDPTIKADETALLIGVAAMESTPVGPAIPIPASASTSIPKFGDTIDWTDDNVRISKYFTIGEVTKGDLARIPKMGSSEEKAILRLAIEFDKVREAWGKPLRVTSWYRPAAINRAVGGVNDSKHILGMAADIAPVDRNEIYDFQTWIDRRWEGALGYGAKKGFVHLDMRNGRGMSATDRASVKGVRWMY